MGVLRFDVNFTHVLLCFPEQLFSTALLEVLRILKISYDLQAQLAQLELFHWSRGALDLGLVHPRRLGCFCHM